MAYEWRVDWDDDGYQNANSAIPDDAVLEWALDWGTTITPTAPSIGLNPCTGRLVLEGGYARRLGFSEALGYPHRAELRWRNADRSYTLVKRCRVVPSLQTRDFGRFLVSQQDPAPSVLRVEALHGFGLEHPATGASLSPDEGFKLPEATSRTVDELLTAVSDASGVPLVRMYMPNDALYGDEIEWSSSWAGFLNWLAGGLGGVAVERTDGSVGIFSVFWAKSDLGTRVSRADEQPRPYAVTTAHNLNANGTSVTVQTDIVRTRFYTDAVPEGTNRWRILGDEKVYGQRQIRVPNVYPDNHSGRLNAVSALVWRVYPSNCVELSFIEDFDQPNVVAKTGTDYLGGCVIPREGHPVPLEEFHVLRVRLNRDRAGVVTRRLTGLGRPGGQTQAPELPASVDGLPVIRILKTGATAVSIAVDLPPVETSGGTWYWYLTPGLTGQPDQYTLPGGASREQRTVLSADFEHPGSDNPLENLTKETAYTFSVSTINATPAAGYATAVSFTTAKTDTGPALTVSHITETSARLTLTGGKAASEYVFSLGGTQKGRRTTDSDGAAVFPLTGLTADTAYTATAERTADDKATASFRTAKKASTITPPPPVTPVAAISPSVSEVTQTAAVVTLTASGPADTWYYRWYRFGVSPPSSSTSWTSKANGDSLEIDLTSLTHSTVYVFEVADNTGFRSKKSVQWTTLAPVRPPPTPSDTRAVSISIDKITKTSVEITLNSTGPAGTWYYRWYRVGVLPPTQSSTWSARNNKDSLVLSGTSALTAGTEYVIDVADNSGFRNKASQKWTTASTTPTPSPTATVLVSVRSITATGASFTLTSETIGSRWFWQVLRLGDVLQSGSLSIPPSKAVTKVLTGLRPSSGHTLNVSRDSKFPSDDRKQVVFSTRTPSPQVTAAGQTRSATWTFKGRWPGLTWTWWITRSGSLAVVKTGSFTTTSAEGGLSKTITAVLEPASAYVLTYSWAGSVNVGAAQATVTTKVVGFSVSKSGTSLRVTATQDVGGRYYVRYRRMPATRWTDDSSLSIPPGGTASRSFGSRQPGVYEVQVSPRSDFGALVKNISIQVS